MANRLAPHLGPRGWRITIVDDREDHCYQPGLLFIPFGIYSPPEVLRPLRSFIPAAVELAASAVEAVEADRKRVRLRDGRLLPFDLLVIATGCGIRPDQTEGLAEGLWHRSIFDFYTLEGAAALAGFLGAWKGGRLVVHVAEMPIKCPVAPLEFVLLADWYFRKRGMRAGVEIRFVTPLPGAFTKPRASAVLGDLLERREIRLTSEFDVARVDTDRKAIVSWDEQTVDFDLLVTIPVNMGAEAIGRSGLGDELNFVPTHRHTLRAERFDDIFVIGDATNLPTSKAGSAVHYQARTLAQNILHAVGGTPLAASYDGHANCFIESGFDRGILIDFTYDQEPLPGTFPFPGIGPFSLLAETRVNHYGKMFFRWAYWNLLLRGRKIPFDTRWPGPGR